jgi:hypothetical protein
MNEKDTSRFDDGQEAPTPSPLKASNTLETLRPRDISWPTATLPGPGYAGAPADVPPEIELAYSPSGMAYAAPVRKTDNPPLQGRGLPPEGFGLEPVQQTDLFTGREQPVKLNANVLPVDWPTAMEAMGLSEIPKKFDYSYKPANTLEDRVTKLEEQVDALLDRIAKHNQRSSHKI